MEPETKPDIVCPYCGETWRGEDIFGWEINVDEQLEGGRECDFECATYKTVYPPNKFEGKTTESGRPLDYLGELPSRKKRIKGCGEVFTAIMDVAIYHEFSVRRK